MDASLQDVFSLLAAIGIGGVVGAYFQSIFQHQRQIKEHEHEMKFSRYKCIIILMLTKLDARTGLPHMRQLRPDLQDLRDIEKEIEVELLNGVLFASDEVVKSIAEFIRKPSYLAYVKTATAMRKDLWGKKTAIDEQVLNIFEKGQ